MWDDFTFLSMLHVPACFCLFCSSIYTQITNEKHQKLEVVKNRDKWDSFVLITLMHLNELWL